jgi:hypothetical protein
MDTRVVNKPTKLTTNKQTANKAQIIVVSKDKDVSVDAKVPVVNELWLKDSLSNK